MTTTVITGATSGIGRATARALGGRGHHIVVAGRSRERGAASVGEIEGLGGSSDFVELDLGSFASVRKAANEIIERVGTIDVVVNNAGVGMAKGVTAEGFEKHFGINHLGHFLLNHLLQAGLRPGARIVTVTSAFHRRVDGIDFGRLETSGRSMFRLDEYAVSKLANILYSAELARKRRIWNTYAVHPGLVNTGILPGWLRLLRSSRLLTPEQGAATVVYCATDAGVDGESGHYYSRESRADPSPAAQDTGLAGELWDRSEQWCDIEWR